MSIFENDLCCSLHHIRTTPLYSNSNCNLIINYDIKPEGLQDPKVVIIMQAVSTGPVLGKIPINNRF